MTNPAQLETAWAQAPPVTVAAAATVDLSAQDSNDVEISGTTGTITSFGTGVPWVRVRVKFQQDGIIVNTAGMANQMMTGGTVLNMRADANGNWALDDTLAAVGGALFTNNYTASGAITVKSKNALVKMWGAGGIGGGSPSGYGGGGAGGYLEKHLTGLTVGNTLTYTQAAGGSGNPTTLASGTQIISTLTCNCGFNNTGGFWGADGGTATGGDINITGQAGGIGYYDTVSTYGYGGSGGVNFYSKGGGGSAPTLPTPGGLLIQWQ
jgi:hypothetical protein